MPTFLSPVDHNPLFHELELTITDEDELAEHVGNLMLGHHLHVENILRTKQGVSAYSPDKVIDLAITKLSASTDVIRYKRDGWLFQMITWVAVNQQYQTENFKCQIPHPAPAQHGIDGLGVLLNKSSAVEAIVITEDKYTENPRQTIKNEVWPEFEAYEKRIYDHQLVGIITGLLRDLTSKQVDDAVQKDIYNINLRIYRLGITPNKSHYFKNGKKKLFKGYDGCVKGASCERRKGITFRQDDIRDWMDDFSEKVADYLESKKS